MRQLAANLAADMNSASQMLAEFVAQWRKRLQGLAPLLTVLTDRVDGLQHYLLNNCQLDRYGTVEFVYLKLNSIGLMLTGLYEAEIARQKCQQSKAKAQKLWNTAGMPSAGRPFPLLPASVPALPTPSTPFAASVAMGPGHFMTPATPPVPAAPAPAPAMGFAEQMAMFTAMLSAVGGTNGARVAPSGGGYQGGQRGRGSFSGHAGRATPQELSRYKEFLSGKYATDSTVAGMCLNCKEMKGKLFPHDTSSCFTLDSAARRHGNSR